MDCFSFVALIHTRAKCCFNTPGQAIKKLSLKSVLYKIKPKFTKINQTRYIRQPQSVHLLLDGNCLNPKEERSNFDYSQWIKGKKSNVGRKTSWPQGKSSWVRYAENREQRKVNSLAPTCEEIKIKKKASFMSHQFYRSQQPSPPIKVKQVCQNFKLHLHFTHR